MLGKPIEKIDALDRADLEDTSRFEKKDKNAPVEFDNEENEAFARTVEDPLMQIK